MLLAELNRTRKIGCEYEMTVPCIGRGNGRDVQETLAAVLTANGIRAIARGYDQSLLPRDVDIAVEYDASVQGESKYAGITWFPNRTCQAAPHPLANDRRGIEALMTTTGRVPPRLPQSGGADDDPPSLPQSL